MRPTAVKSSWPQYALNTHRSKRTNAQKGFTKLASINIFGHKYSWRKRLSCALLSPPSDRFIRVECAGRKKQQSQFMWAANASTQKEEREKAPGQTSVEQQNKGSPPLLSEQECVTKKEPLEPPLTRSYGRFPLIQKLNGGAGQHNAPVFWSWAMCMEVHTETHRVHIRVMS